MTPRATALLAVRPAKMYSCIFRQSKLAASAACKKARQCSSMSPRDRRAGRLRTSGLRNSNFVRKGAANAAALFLIRELLESRALIFLLLRVRCEPGISRSSSAILQSPAGCCSPAQKCTYCPCLDHTPHCSVEPVYEHSFGKAVDSADSQDNLRSPRQQHALFQMPRNVRVRGGVRVVGHHHNRLTEVLVQAFENLQNLSSRVAVEVAGRFVREQ